MHPLFLAPLLVLGPASSGSPEAGAADGDDHVLAGDHFELRAFGTTLGIARAALATADAVEPRARALYGSPGERPLVVHLLPTAAEYQRVDRKLTGGNFADNLAFSSFRTRAAYVALQPESEPATFDVLGLPDLTRHQIAHEAAHVVCYNALESHPHHPTWFSEGAAIWIAEETLIERGWSPGLTEDPFTAKWILLVQELIEDGRAPRLSVLLRGETGDLGPYDRYALWGLVFRFLGEETDDAAFAELWRRARELPSHRRFAEDLWGVVDHVWGEERLRGELTDAFFRWIQALEPRWDQTGRSLETNGPAWTQIAFPNEAASAWCLEVPDRPEWTLSGALEIVAGRDRDGLELLVGRRGAGHLVAHLARDGRATLERFRPYRTWPGPIERLADARLAEPVGDRRIPFRLRVAPDRLVWRVGDVELETATSPVDRTGDWGLSARAGVAGVWHDVRVQ